MNAEPFVSFDHLARRMEARELARISMAAAAFGAPDLETLTRSYSAKFPGCRFLFCLDSRAGSLLQRFVWIINPTSPWNLLLPDGQIVEVRDQAPA
jgi:hypothetical protein